MAGLDPAIQTIKGSVTQSLDHRLKAGDEEE